MRSGPRFLTNAEAAEGSLEARFARFHLIRSQVRWDVRPKHLGWEGWLRTPDGQVGHGDAPQGTADLSELTKEQALDLSRRTIHAAHAEWNGSTAHPGAELLFCISVAAA